MIERWSRRQFALLGAAPFLIAADAQRGPVSGLLTQWRTLAPKKRYDAAFEYLASHDMAKLAPGRYPIDGDRVYVTISEAKARDPKAGHQFEAHRHFADIHYLIAGKEMIGTVPLAQLKSKGPYKEDGDIELFEIPSSYRRIVLAPGSFALFEPGQSHMPGCDAGSPLIRKAVVKIQYTA